MARVLVVDDALMMRKTIGNFLAKAGHVVVEEAANGNQAVAAYKNHLPDLVTMDITMPEVDGIGALQQIIAFDPQARVVMVSALGQKHKVFDALQHGAKGYILKPFTADKLLLIINELLGATHKGEKECREYANPFDKKTVMSKMAFTVEKQEGTAKIALLRELTQADFDELAKEINNIRVNQAEEILLDFTYGSTLHNRSAPAYLKIIEEFIDAGGRLRIVCYTLDYTTYFRSLASLQAIEFQLAKKCIVQ